MSVTPAEAAHLRFIRRHIPEPASTDAVEVTFHWPESVHPKSKLGSLVKRNFQCEGIRFVAWSYDGKKPLFPEWDC